MKALVDTHRPDAEMIRVVLDNLNTHHPATLYENFPAEEANRILKKLEFHYTPKHASWLNQVEIEFSVLSRQCLDRRIPSKEQLSDQITIWKDQRNAQKATVNWRFSSTDARVKLGSLHPIVEPS